MWTMILAKFPERVRHLYRDLAMEHEIQEKSAHYTVCIDERPGNIDMQ